MKGYAMENQIVFTLAAIGLISLGLYFIFGKK